MKVESATSKACQIDRYRSTLNSCAAVLSSLLYVWLGDQRRASCSRSLDRPFRFVAVIKGVPLKIKPLDAPYEGDRSVGGPVGGYNEASVDSELAVPDAFRRKSPDHCKARTSALMSTVRMRLEAAMNWVTSG
jgi:hypothetical protein